MTTARAVLSVAPHPDDELLGAPATLMALRDTGWRVVNLACSLGREEDHARRRAELTEACRRAGFELEIPDGLAPIGRDDDLDHAQAVLSGVIADATRATGAELIIGPSPHDGHHGHEVVGRAIRDAVEARTESIEVMFWGLWGELPVPNLLVSFDGDRLTEIQRALAAHAGELARNRLDRLLEAHATTSAVLGPERVFGFGVAGTQSPYVELLTAVSWSPSEGWRIATPREFDPSRALMNDGGAEIGWWLHAASVRSELRARQP